MTREEAREVIEELNDGKFAIDRHFALTVLGAYGAYIVFENESDAVTAVMLAVKARRAGEVEKICEIREALELNDD